MTNKTYNFEAETGKILELLTHSIYSNKEIFLRELISNSSDAIDKARIKSITDTSYLGDNNKFEIKVTTDKKANTIIIEDNGIGMSEEEVKKNIGTIAKSGTKDFIEKLKEAKEQEENNLIGQFGIGFYSSFIVADKVTLETKSTESDKATVWISDGKGSYEIKEGTKTTRGTTLTLHLSKESKEFIEDWKLRELIKKYSNYVKVPVMMLELDNRNEEEKKKEPNKEFGYEQINETKSIWTKNKSEVKEEEYNEFYKTLSHDFQAPLANIHLDIEGATSYKSILFIPEKASMFGGHDDPSKDYGPKLFTNNVLILENSKELLPVWLRFISGVVETSDLPLNASREMLQSNQVLEKIQKGLVKKIITKLKAVNKKTPEKYNSFLENYGKFLKEGIHYEADLKEDIAALVKFKSMNEDKIITLDEYLEKAKAETREISVTEDGEESTKNEEIKTIYYITGKSEAEVLANPYLEQFRKKGVDVLLMSEQIDIYVVQALKEYSGAKLVNATSGEVELEKETEEVKKEKEEKNKEFKDLLELVKNTIGTDKLEVVKLTNKLGDTVGALRTKDGGMDPQMEKMMKSMGQPIPPQTRILEINPDNNVTKVMMDEFKSDVKSEKLKDLINYTYYQAILAEGGEIENISDFIKLTNKFAGK